MRKKKKFGSEKGTIMPLAAVTIGTVLAMTALAVDIGYIVSTRGELEKAADASALASIVKPYTPVATADQIARDFAAQHVGGGQNVLLSSAEFGRFDFPSYFANGDAEAAFLLGASPITAARVVAARDTNVATGPLGLFFAKILGIQDVNVSRRAIAVHNPYVSGAPARTHVIPLTVHRSLVENPDGSIKVGQSVDIRLKTNNPSGNFGWLSTLWDQSHAPDVPGLRDAIENGLPVDARTPADVYGTPGTKGGSLNEAFLALMDPNGNGDETQGAYAGHGLKTQNYCDKKGLMTFSACTGITQPLTCTPSGCTETCTETCSPPMPGCPTCPPACTTNCTTTCTTYTCTGGNDYNSFAETVNPAVVYIPVYSTSSEQGAGALFHIEYFIAAYIEEAMLTGALEQRRVTVRILGTPTYPPQITSDLYLDENAKVNPTLQKLQLIA